MNNGQGPPPPGVTQERICDVVVLRLIGVMDQALADDLRERALEARAPVVIDLAGSVRLDGAAIRSLISGWTVFRPTMCVIAAEPGDRRMMQSVDPGEAVPVFASLDDALAALGRRRGRRSVAASSAGL